MRRSAFVWLSVWFWLATAFHAVAADKAASIEDAKADVAARLSAAEDEYELQRLLVDTIDQVQRNYVREVPRRKLIEAAIKGVLKELDPYSSYISPDEMERFRASVESEFGGIGIQVGVDRGEGLKVVSPLAGTPAYRAGIVAGDRIVEIDGKSTEDVTIDEAVRKLKGPEGSKITLTVIHPGKTERQKIALTREAIHVETVLGDRRKPDQSWDYLIDGQKKIAYIRITGFSRDTANELRKVLTDLQKEKIRGMVLDLRFNPGGLLNSAVEIADMFIEKGRIVSTAGRNSPERTWEAHKEGTFEGFPVAILVNHYSASASEIVAACLQDHKRAVVVGERTWGKGSVQNVIPLDDYDHGEKASESHEPRSALKLTTAGYKRPSGKNIDRAPDAGDTDEWGVKPNDGLEVKLEGHELFTLMADRRQRDIISAQPEAKKPEAAEPESKPGADPDQKFVDRQLQKALDYLTAELARAQ